MEVTTRETTMPEVDPVQRPWTYEPEGEEAEGIHASGSDETPTEPGYGHGV